MSTAEITAEAAAVLRAFVSLVERNEVPTVHAACNIAGVTFMRTFDLVNELHSAGLITHDLKPTDAGRKLISS